MSKVSIIIPIYNVKDYVNKTIDSVINQTEKDIEIILVDDGSTDGCTEICDQYKKSDKRIKVIHKKNGGLSSARNTGTEIAESEFVMYLDGDDYLRKDAVKKVLDIMKKYPCDFVQFRYKEVSNNKEENSLNENKDRIYQVKGSKKLFDNLYQLGGVAASGATKLIRKDLMKKIPFKSIRHEDEMWCSDAFQNDLTATYISDELYFYVMRENSIIHDDFNEKKLEIFDVYDYRINILKKLQYDDLLSIAYQRMFITIITLYWEAKISKSQKSMEKLFFYFKKNKNDIKKYANLSLKFKIIFNLMYFNFNFICIYILCKNLRREG